jgi:cell division protein FtsW
VVGLLVMLAVSRIDYHRYHRLAKPVLLVSIFLLLLLVLPFTHSITPVVNRVRRWIVWPLTFQPSELARLALVLWGATTIVNKGEKIGDFREGILPFVSVLAGVAVLVALEPDLSTAVLLFAVAILLLFLGKARLRHILAVAGIFAAGFVLATVLRDYSIDRFLTIISSDADPLNRDYHLNQCRIALGSGGWFGRGIGNGLQKYFFLPEPHTDSLLAAIGEELGFLGTAGLLLLYLYFGFLGYRVMMRCHDLLGFLLVGGVFASILVPVILTTAINMGAVPSAGIGLPLISYGGSSMVTLLGGFGIVLNVVNQNRTGIRRMRRRI